MNVTAKLPGTRSRAARRRRRARRKGGALTRIARREATQHPRAVAAGAVGVMGAAAAALAKRSRNGGPRVHTTPQEGHPAGTGVRSDRDIGGPTSPDQADGTATGGAPGTPPRSGFEPHT